MIGLAVSTSRPDPSHSRSSAIHWRNSDQGEAQRLRLRVLMRGNARACRLLPIGERTLAQFLSGAVSLDAKYLAELHLALDELMGNAGLNCSGLRGLP